MLSKRRPLRISRSNSVLTTQQQISVSCIADKDLAALHLRTHSHQDSTLARIFTPVLTVTESACEREHISDNADTTRGQLSHHINKTSPRETLAVQHCHPVMNGHWPRNPSGQGYTPPAPGPWSLSSGGLRRSDRIPGAPSVSSEFNPSTKRVLDSMSNVVKQLWLINVRARCQGSEHHS